MYILFKVPASLVGIFFNLQVMYIPIEDIEKAYAVLQEVVYKTPFIRNLNLSAAYNCKLYLKREDLQRVRSYKLRGAYYKMANLEQTEKNQGIVCASAGNHAQGVAYACHHLNIQGKIYMPHTTPNQKVRQVKMFGKEHVEVVLTGDTFDMAYESAMQDCRQHQKTFLHPFDDEAVITGQGTVGYEMLHQLKEPLDYIFIPVGGGGLAAGVTSYVKQKNPHTKIIGVEPAGAPAMYKSMKAGEVITLSRIDKFVDGASVQRVGEKTFKICKEALDEILLVPEGKVCSTILKLYNEEAIVVEPAGALTIAALDFYKDKIKGKKVACVVSGGNNDIIRMEEIKEKSLLYEGLKHYFLIIFPQRAGALKEFLVNVLGPDDDITRFEYTKKNNRENGPALVGIEVKQKSDYDALLQRMNEYQISYQLVNEQPEIFNLLV